MQFRQINHARGRLIRLIMASVALWSASSAGAAMVNLGSAGNFKVLGFDNISGTPTMSITNPQSTIMGHVGLGPGVKQNFSDGTITGVYFVDPTSNNTHGNNVVFMGGTVTQSLAQAKDDALAASALAASLIPTQTFGDIVNATTIFGNGGDNIISIHSINFTGASDILTLQGGPNDTFVINIAQSMQVVLTQGNATIRGDGIDPSRILFNFPNTSGDALKLSGNPVIEGTYLAPTGNIVLSSGRVNGRIIAGGNINIVSGSQIVPEPASGAVLAGLLLLMATMYKRSVVTRR